jgi:WD40 repeat protein
VTLLDRVQNKPDIEEDLRKLRQRRLKERGDAVYIPPQAKANLKASDDVLFALTEKVEKFLASADQKVLLLLGDSGSGKSTFNREIEHNLWLKYEKAKGWIPLYINLSAIDRPEQDMIAKQLRKFEFSNSQIRELKAQRKFVLICDGYDESQKKHNLYTTNRLNQTGEWQVQMVVSCRSEYIGLDYRDLFQPSNDITEFQEAVIAPFSRAQIDDYLAQYVITKAPLWTKKQYMDVLDQIPSLQELIKNPFLLTLSLEVLPRLVDPGKNLTAIRITRVALYDEFVGLWLEQGKKRLGNRDLNPQARADFDRLTDEGFTQNGISFLKDMASAIYKNQAGNPVVTYSRKQDHGKWKEAFFSRENESQLLLEASPLKRSGIQYRFIHKSLLEYFFARSVFEPQESKENSVQAAAPARRGSVSSVFSFDEQLVPDEDDEPVTTQPSTADHPLSWRSFMAEPSILDFLSERVQQEPLFKDQLLAMIEQSKFNRAMRKAAANAITILVRAGIRFNGADLRGIQIPRADLSGGQFDSAQLEGADLRKANLRNTWLRQANFSKAQMAGVQFGELPYVQELDTVHCSSYSPNGETCVFGLADGTISVYDTMTWTKTHTLQEHTSSVRSVAYSPSGHQIASGSDDKTVRLWDIQTGEPGPVLSGHAKAVKSVAYSPSGHQIASGSYDETVRLWDAQTGAPGPVLRGHANSINSVAYSPSGHQIASGSCDKTVRLWDTQTGAPGPVLSGHTDYVNSVAYSPSGRQIASGSDDETVRLWDTQTGAPGPVLSGHTDYVISVAYSPSGHQIASGSYDKTVRLWDTQTGAPGPVFSGHTDYVNSVAYSPNGHQIASGSYDKTVRLWDMQISAPGPVLSGHTNAIESVAYSPTGHQIASGSCDNTVRLWDTQTGEPGHVLCGHTDYVIGVAYSPSGHQIASCGYDTTVRLWDTQTGAPGLVLSGHTNAVESVAYSPSGHQIASGSCDKTVRLWDTQTGAPGPILSGHTNYVINVAYSPSGYQIASGSYDTTVRLWDTQTGAPGLVLSGHTDYVDCVAYSPSGHQIASGSSDKTVRLWDANSGGCLVVVKDFHGPINGVAWKATHDDIYLVTGCGDTFVRLWQIVEEKSIFQALLQWSSAHNRLTVSGASMEDARGLSRVNVRLLQQHGAVGDPKPVITLQTAGNIMSTVKSAASKFGQLRNSKMITSSFAVSSLVQQLDI